jgi:hypothetical protein
VDYAPHRLLDIGATAVIRYNQIAHGIVHHEDVPQLYSEIKLTAKPPSPRSRSPSRYGRGINLSGAWSIGSWNKVPQRPIPLSRWASQPDEGLRHAQCPTLRGSRFRRQLSVSSCARPKALSALIDHQMRVDDGGASALRSARTVVGLMLAAIVLNACTGQTTEPGNAKQRAPFHYDPPDPYHYRQPFQAG